MSAPNFVDSVPGDSVSVTRREFLNAAVIGTIASRAWAADGATSRKIRIGQIGVGHAHASKLSVYRASSDYEVVGVVEPDERLRRRAEQDSVYHGLPWMTREQLLNMPGLDAVLVETRVAQLLDAAEACIAAGKHIHLDKPAGSSFPHFERIMASAQRQSLLVQMGYMYRYSPAVKQLRQCLRDGWLGDVFEVHAVMSKTVGLAERQALAEFAGGSMFELGCHLTDLVVEILGKPDAVTPHLRHSAELADSLHDNCLAILDYPRATATIRSAVIEVDGGARRQLTVCGTKGTFHIQPLDNPSARVTFSEAHGPLRKGYQDFTYPQFPRYVADAADMAQVIRGEKPSDFSYAHDLAVQETVLRASNMPLTD